MRLTLKRERGGVTDAEAHLVTVGEAIDSLSSIEITGRGVVRTLYTAARAAQPVGPLCLTAAQELRRRVQPGDPVIVATGLPTHPWFSGEQDGPVGAATLARALLLGLAARPVILTEGIHVDMCRAAVRAAGLYARGLDDALRLPTTAAVLAFPTDPADAESEAARLIDRVRPKAMIAIERPGANEYGHYHGAKGARLTDHCAKVDVAFAQGKNAGVYTIGIGDGGNELGCATIRDTIVATVPYAAKCKCPCGGSVVPTFVPDLLVIAAISNWAPMASKPPSPSYSSAPKFCTTATSTGGYTSSAQWRRPTTTGRDCSTRAPMQYLRASTATSSPSWDA